MAPLPNPFPLPDFEPAKTQSSSAICSTNSFGSHSFTLTDDMYGTGVRLGFYIQSLTLLLCTTLLPSGPKNSRGISVGMAASISVAFFKDANRSILSIEYPVFISLMTVVLLPSIIEPLFRVRHNWGSSNKKGGGVRVGVIQGRGSYVLATLLYSADLLAGVYAYLHAWNRDVADIQACGDVLTYLGGSPSHGTSALSGAGKASWGAIIFLGFVLTIPCIIAGCIGITTILSRSKKTIDDDDEQRWIHNRGGKQKGLMMLWLAVSLVVFGLSTATVETTIRLNKITTPGVDTLGQIISLIAGVGSVVSFLWNVL